ncbi:MAG: energy coupling factor transporter S component ThiW, partial [Candidatus Hodarchaeota archaeon]
MNEKDLNEEKGGRKVFQNNLTRKTATAAIFVGVGIVLGHLNPFAVIPIIGAKIFPFAHFINAITGVLLGLAFSTTTAFDIAILRFSLAL